MNPLLTRALALAFLLTATALPAQVPQLINYQGRVAVGTVNFDGSGAFKFALVNGAGTVTYWSNDGTSTAGSQPTAAVSLTVTKGLYSVLLGDAGLPNMTAVPASVFANPDVRLRVWFNDGTNGSQLLTPDQRIAAVGYALMAGGVNLPATTSATEGVITQNGSSLMHTFGSQNFFAGPSAGNFTMTGNYNTATGVFSLNQNTTGYSNTASGSSALYGNTTGSGNVAVGYGSLSSNTTGNVNTALGAGALSLNVAGSSNTASGSAALSSNTTGSRNTANGADTLSSNITGSSNTASGAAALYSNTTGTRNTALGDSALRFNATGSNNTGIGDNTLQNNTTGVNNTATGRTALDSNTTGNQNIALGYRAGHNLTTGDNNIDIGHQGVAGESGIIRIGDGTTQTDTYLTGIIHGNGSGLTGVTAAVAPGSITNALLSNPFVTMNTGSGLSGGGPVPLGGTLTLQNTGVTSLTGGGGITVSSANGTVTLGSNASATNLPSTIVLRDASGNFSAGTITGTFVGSGTGLTGITLPAASLAGTISNAQIGAGAITGTKWTDVTTNGAPTARRPGPAVWTGTEMIVWGGWTNPALYGDGAKFSPANGTWTAVSSIGAPSGRDSHTAVWTGSQMIVWGGRIDNNNTNTNTGGLYNPSTNAWASVTTTGAPSARSGHTGIWTGSVMIVWGGYDGATLVNTGSRYNPSTNTWSAMSTTGAPTGRFTASAVWTGTEMIVFGGSLIGGITTNTGARYNPATDTWTAISTTNAPSVRTNAAAVWTGSEMIVFGGQSVGPTGGRYNPTTNTWIATPATGAPLGNDRCSVVWTGSAMLVWGGIDNTQVNVYNSGASFSPTTNTWTPLVLTGAPSARGAHATVWTGSEMIVWGGGSSNQQADMVNTGGRYSSQIGTGAVDTEALASNLTLGGTTTGSFSGTLNLVSTTSASAGLVTQSGNPLLHTYGTSNFFAGIGAGNFTLTGINNIAIGASAGSLLSTGGNNIDIGHVGVATDAATIRIGTPGTQTKAFVAGIRGVTTGAANAINVLIDSNGQLGTVSSSRRYKEDIADMGDASARLLSLRPVSFRYKQPFADGGKPLQFGLIAEEVAVAFPELAVFNAEGQPETVKYQDLAPLLLNEVQKLTVEKEELKRQLAERDARDKERDARISRLERLLPSAPAAATKEN